MIWRRRKPPQPDTLDVTVVLRTGDQIDLVAHYYGVDPSDGMHLYVVDLTAELGDADMVTAFKMPVLPGRNKVVMAASRQPQEGEE